MRTSRLTAEEAEALERKMLIDMAQRYGAVLEKSKRRNHMAENTKTSERPEALTGVESLVRVTQLPVIEERLRQLKSEIEKRVQEAMSLVCTADTIQTCKDARADLNRKFADLEEVRKRVKKQVMSPYERFEDVYHECVTELFRRADADLKGKIDSVETELKSVCEQNLQAYFCELRDARGLPWLEYERAGIKVDMASAKAKTPKKLMDALRLFVDSVAANTKMIDGMDDAAEIMAEYKATLDAAGSIATVQQRKKRIEAERQAAEERARAKAELDDPDPTPIENATAYAPPKAVQRAEVKRYALDLHVEGTLEQMRLIKLYLSNNGLSYRATKFEEVQ